MPDILLTKDGYNFETFITRMRTASSITIVTWSIDDRDGSELLRALRSLPTTSRLTIISSIPKRFDSYFGNAATRARENIDAYIAALKPARFQCQADVWFCFQNHSKIILCDGLAYLGSANFTSASKANFEGGYLTDRATEIERIITFIAQIKQTSVPYFTLGNSSLLAQVFEFRLLCRNLFRMSAAVLRRTVV